VTLRKFMTWPRHRVESYRGCLPAGDGGGFSSLSDTSHQFMAVSCGTCPRVSIVVRVNVSRFSSQMLETSCNRTRDWSRAVEQGSLPAEIAVGGRVSDIRHCTLSCHCTLSVIVPSLSSLGLECAFVWVATVHCWT
jgi:hypothetical protein